MSYDLLTALVPYVVPVIIIFSISIATAAYQHLLQWLPPNKRATLEYAVNCAVHAVEQVAPGDAGPVKKHEAELRVGEILRQFHVSMPAQVIDSSIEAAVHVLNMAQSQAPAQESIMNQVTAQMTAVKPIVKMQTAQVPAVKIDALDADLQKQ